MHPSSYIAKQFAAPKGLGGSVISLVMNRQNRPLYDETIRLLSLSDSDSVLDIGCGNGFVLSLLARRHSAEFAGIDPSDAILRAARLRNRKYTSNHTMRFACEDVLSLSFPDASFSKAYAINTVYFWQDLALPMQKIRQALKPSGIFINTLYTNDTLSRFSHTRFGYTRHDAQALIRAGEDVGFAVSAVPIMRGEAMCYVYQKQADTHP